MISRTYLDVDGVITVSTPCGVGTRPCPAELSVHRCNGYNIYLPNYMTELVGAAMPRPRSSGAPPGKTPPTSGSAPLSALVSDESSTPA